MLQNLVEEKLNQILLLQQKTNTSDSRLAELLGRSRQYVINQKYTNKKTDAWFIEASLKVLQRSQLTVFKLLKISKKPSKAIQSMISKIEESLEGDTTIDSIECSAITSEIDLSIKFLSELKKQIISIKNQKLEV